ncbi:hypothetical protein SLEP1_g32763 [Rubroshorea leprosula]|uniref:Uncharacterized protein n=1 Tax=Rubroshorea leprosula TaxID=152421 RepID=A0AAV5KEI0_9ROSI|nr:hypothetical protein SLEP1_g32763 [Rubroshorea leprosula]
MITSIFRHFVLLFLVHLFSLQFLSLQASDFSSHSTNLTLACRKTEKNALLKFKEGLKDPSGRLSSWVGDNCCAWHGIGCDPQTGHVTELDLRNPYGNQFLTRDPTAFELSSLQGEINPSLLGLKYLNYLDLSSNNFEQTPIPNFIGSFTHLHYLNLSYASFSGLVPPHLGNLSNLQYLDLSTNSILMGGTFQHIWVSDLNWISSLSLLKHLNLGEIDLSSTSTNWLQNLNMLPSLVELHLPYCNLRNLPPSLSVLNFSSIMLINLHGNDINSSLPNWLFNISTLVKLRLSDNEIRGSLTNIDAWKNNPCNLQALVLSRNRIMTGEIVKLVEGLSKYCNNSLEELDLSYNDFDGQIPPSLGNLKNMKYLFLHQNSFSGSIPTNFKLELFYLDLSENHLNGSIPCSINKLENLELLSLEKNQLSGEIPSWKTLRRLGWLDLSNNNLSGTIPTSLCSQSQPFYVKLNNNNLHGKLSSLRNCTSLVELSVANNQFSGSIPRWIVETLPWLQILQLRGNMFRGKIPTNFCLLSKLHVLDLRLNTLLGLIPPCLGNLSSLHRLVNHSSDRYCDGYGFILYHYWDDHDMEFYVKGKWLDFTHILDLLNLIDLSSNNLEGDIPEEIMKLSALVSESIHSYVSSAETSHEGWVILKRLYANSSHTRINALKERLQNLRCEGRAVAEYLRTAKILIDRIGNAEKVPLSNCDIQVYLLNGLGHEYSEFKALIRARDGPPQSFEDLHDRLLAHEESLQREEAPVNDNNTPITAQFASVHPRIVGNHNSYGGFSDRNSVGGYQNFKGLQEYSNRSYQPNYGTNQYVPMGRGGGRGHRGARGGKNNRNSFNRDCQELKNHAHVANFATTSTSKKGDWWIDSGASDHVTLDLANLALHSEYDGLDELLIGDGSAGTTVSQARPQAATPSVSSSEINQVCSLNSSSSSHSAHALTSSPIILPAHRSTTPPVPHCSPLRSSAQSSPPTKLDTNSGSHQPTSTLSSSPATSSQLMPSNATSLSPSSNATTDSSPTPQPPPVPSCTHGMITSPVIKPITIKIVLSMALNQNWPIRQLDVHNAFLHGKPEEELFMAQPPGNPKLVDSLIKLMGNTFSIKDLGALNYFLGVNAIFTPAGLFLSQAQYIRDLLDEFGMAEAKPVSSPMATAALQLLPSVSYAFHGLLLRRQPLSPLHAFSDSDWAGDKDTLQSTTSFIVFLGSTLISWKACKQKAVARSSTEAEYRALAAASSEVIWVCNILRELGHPISSSPAIYCDHIGATHLSSNLVMHTRMKHIAIDLHFVRALVD